MRDITRRWLWLAAIWVLSVVSLGVVALLLRLILKQT
jgi:hypothetical protein